MQFGTCQLIIVQCLHCHFLWTIAQTAALLLCLPVVTQGISMGLAIELHVLWIQQ